MEPTDFDPDPEQFGPRAANAPGSDSGLREDDRNSQQQSDRRDVDHVASDDAEVEDLGVDPAHAVESGLFLMAMALRHGCASSRIDLCEPPASAMEHARLFRLFIVG